MKIGKKETLDEQSPRTLRTDQINQGKPMAVRGGGGSLPHGPQKVEPTRLSPQGSSFEGISISKKHLTGFGHINSGKIMADSPNSKLKGPMMTSSGDIAQSKDGQSSRYLPLHTQ